MDCTKTWPGWLWRAIFISEDKVNHKLRNNCKSSPGQRRGKGEANNTHTALATFDLQPVPFPLSASLITSHYQIAQNMQTGQFIGYKKQATCLQLIFSDPSNRNRFLHILGSQLIHERNP